MSIWPNIPYSKWQATGSSLHMWCQIIGKFRLAQTPWINHSWQATFYVNGTGLTTSLIPGPKADYEITLDFITHELRIQSTDGQSKTMKLKSMSVAKFDDQFRSLLASLGAPTDFHHAPNEVPDPVPFAEQKNKGDYNPDAAAKFWRALVAIDTVFKKFRTGFLGKVSPVHLFWGSFDLAVTRFSGRPAPLHPGGIPALPDPITREAYSHEVSSAGFWPGGGGIDAPTFYAYAYPAPDGFKNASILPADASFNEQLGEFVLPYEAVRTSANPEETLLQFLQSTYLAAANLGGWNRDELETDIGLPRVPRPL